MHRVLGGRSRVRMADLEIRHIVAVLSPGGADTEARLRQYGIRRWRRACSTRACTEGMILVYQNEKEEHEAIAVEPDEQALRLLRYYNSSVMKGRNHQ